MRKVFAKITWCAEDVIYITRRDDESVPPVTIKEAREILKDIEGDLVQVMSDACWVIIDEAVREYLQTKKEALHDK